jgi:hypothetical protein
MRKRICRHACSVLFVASLPAQELDVMFVLETSPGTEQAIGLIQSKELKESDRAGVIGFRESVQLLQSLTQKRDALDTALQRAGTRIAVGLGSGRGGAMNFPVNVAGAVQDACNEFGGGDSDRKRVIILLFASEDRSLGARLESVRAALGAAKARLYVVVIQRVPAPELPARPTIDNYPFPVITVQLLSQITADSGGRIYRRAWDLKSTLAAARKP